MVRLYVTLEFLILTQLLIALTELTAVWWLLVQGRATIVLATTTHALGIG